MNEHAAKIEARFRNYLIVVNEQDYTAARKAAQILAEDIHDTDIPSILAFLAMELTGKGTVETALLPDLYQKIQRCV